MFRGGNRTGLRNVKSAELKKPRRCMNVQIERERRVTKKIILIHYKTRLRGNTQSLVLEGVNRPSGSGYVSLEVLVSL